MTYENPFPGNQLQNVTFDETYEGGSFRRSPWYPGMANEPNSITSIVVVKDGPYHRPKYTTVTHPQHSWLDSTEIVHRPVLDIDFPATLVPSSTPGHFHLFLDKELPWTVYAVLLKALGDAGILEPGYVSASLARQHTTLRLPGVKKEDVR